MYNPADLPLPKIRERETEGMKACYYFPQDMPPEEYQRMCAAYYAMISQIDYHIGRIVDVLKEKGLYDNTIIIYTSDHGDYNGDHGHIRKGAWLFDSILRVPMIVRYPAADNIGINYKGNTQHEEGSFINSKEYF